MQFFKCLLYTSRITSWVKTGGGHFDRRPSSGLCLVLDVNNVNKKCDRGMGTGPRSHLFTLLLIYLFVHCLILSFVDSFIYSFDISLID